MYLLRLTLASASLVVTRWGAGLDAAISRISHSDSSCTPCTVYCPPLPEPFLPLAQSVTACALLAARNPSLSQSLQRNLTSSHKQSSASSALVLALSAYRSFDRAVTVDGLSQYCLGSSVDSTRWGEFFKFRIFLEIILAINFCHFAGLTESAESAQTAFLAFLSCALCSFCPVESTYLGIFC